MFNRGNIHLWLIGGASFFGFGFVKLATKPVEAAIAQSDSQENSAVVIDIAEAEKLYLRRCGACHSLDAHRIGPRHRGVVGREAGSLADYEYSPALRNAEFVWNEQQLDQWLSNPEALVPGQKMGFRISNGAERNAIIAYLRAQSE